MNVLDGSLVTGFFIEQALLFSIRYHGLGILSVVDGPMYEDFVFDGDFPRVEEVCALYSPQVQSMH